MIESQASWHDKEWDEWWWREKLHNAPRESVIKFINLFRLFWDKGLTFTLVGPWWYRGMFKGSSQHQQQSRSSSNNCTKFINPSQSIQTLQAQGATESNHQLWKILIVRSEHNLFCFLWIIYIEIDGFYLFNDCIADNTSWRDILASFPSQPFVQVFLVLQNERSLIQMRNWFLWFHNNMFV